MKTSLSNSVMDSRRGERGMAMIIVMVIISILLIYVGGNIRTLHLLKNDLKQVEQKQLIRVQAASSRTNVPAATNSIPAQQSIGSNESR